MDELRFEVKGDPVPKARPRLGAGKAYTPQRTQAYQDMVGWVARMAMVDQRCEMFTLPVAVQMTFYYGNGRADLDNLIKAAWDAMNGVVWQDDIQVTQVLARVYRGQPKETRRVEIRVCNM